MARAHRGTTVVVLGGGVGGVTAARALRERLSAADRIVLVERSEQLTFAGTTLLVLMGKREPEKLSHPYQGLSRHGIEFVRAEVTRLDVDARRVLTTAGDLPYDYLVVALGAESDMSAVPGLAEAGLNLHNPLDMVRLREVLSFFPGGRVAIAVSSLPFNGPTVPYEAALIVESLLRRHGSRDRSAVDLYTPEPGPMWCAIGEQTSANVRAFLEERGVTLHLNRRLTSVDPKVQALRFDDGTTAPYDLLAAVPPQRPPAPVRESPLAGPGGWIVADPQTLATAVERVYAIGDVTSVSLPSGHPLPKTAVFARAEAEIVAHNIAMQVKGRGRAKAFAAVGECQMETGDGRAFAIEVDFSALPEPLVELKGPTLRHHYEKVYLERSVLNMV